MPSSIVELEQLIASQPQEATHYVNIIALLRQDQHKEKLEDYRIRFAENSVPEKTFWLNWLEDVIKTTQHADDEALPTINDRFRDALASCPCIEIALKYLDQSILMFDEEKMDENALRDVFEYLIALCGGDINTGGGIWERYRAFELDEHEDLVQTQADEQTLQKSKARFIRIYNRQLSLPMLGNEAVLVEFEEKLSEFCVESDASIIKPRELSKKVQIANEMRQARLIYETSIQSEKYAALTTGEEKYNSYWRTYIEFEIKQQQLTRALRLYDRATMECSDSIHLWLDYIEYVLVRLKNWKVLLSLMNKVVKVQHTNLMLWKLLFSCLSVTGASCNAVQTVFSRALAYNFPSVEDYFELYLCACNFFQQRLVQAIEDNRRSSNSALPAVTVTEDSAVLLVVLQHIDRTVSETQHFLFNYCSQWITGWWRWCKYYATLEHSLLAPIRLTLRESSDDDTGHSHGDNEVESNSTVRKQSTNCSAAKQNIPAGTSTWDTALTYFPESSFLWSEYIAWLKNIQEWELCRRVYKKMMSIHRLDVPKETICREWLIFEQQYGSADDLQAAYQRTFPLLKAETIQQLQQTLLHTSSSSCSTGSTDSPTSSNVRSPADLLLPESTQAIRTADNHSKRKRDPDPSSDSFLKDSGGDCKGNETTTSLVGRTKKVKFSHVEDDKINDTSASTIPPSAASVQANESSEHVDSVRRDNILIPPSDKTPSADSSPSVSVPVPMPKKVLQTEVVKSKNTIEVKNFPFTATLDSIRPMIEEKCPGLKEIRMLLSKAGKSRGIVEVEFPSMCDDELVGGEAVGGEAVGEAVASDADPADSSEVVGTVHTPKTSTMTSSTQEGSESEGNTAVAESDAPPPQQQALQQQQQLAAAVDALNGYEYNGRALKACVKETIVKDDVISKSASTSSKKDQQQKAGSLATPHLTTVFVSQLPPSITTVNLKDVFKSCGEILAAKVAVDKKTGKSKCNGLVQFASQTARDKALKFHKSTMEGSEINVMPSRFSLITVADQTAVSAATNESERMEENRTNEVSAQDTINTTTVAPKPPSKLTKMSTLSFKPRSIPKHPKPKI